MVCDRFVCSASLSAPFLIFTSRLFTTVCLYLSRFIVLKAYISRGTKIYLLFAQHFQSSTIRNDLLILTDCIPFTCHCFNSCSLLSRFNLRRKNQHILSEHRPIIHAFCISLIRPVYAETLLMFCCMSVTYCGLGTIFTVLDRTSSIYQYSYNSYVVLLVRTKLSNGSCHIKSDI